MTVVSYPLASFANNSVDIEINLVLLHEVTNVISFPSNNMLYPKEDKERRILLYAVSIHYGSVAFIICHANPTTSIPMKIYCIEGNFGGCKLGRIRYKTQLANLNVYNVI